MIAIATLLLVIVISLLVTRVGAVILVASGMSRSAAKFQARSAFTGAGFTTAESEQVVDHPLRRKVVGTLMLLGNAGIVAAASTTILGFRSGGVGRQGWRLLELVLGLLALVYISRSRWVDRWLTETIGRVLHKYTDLPSRDLVGLLDLAGDYAVNELAVSETDWVANRTLSELELREEGLALLGITRTDGRYLGIPNGATRVEPGDVLVIYGSGDHLRELDDRPAGPDGDLAHDAAVVKQRRAEHDHSTDV